MRKTIFIAVLGLIFTGCEALETTKLKFAYGPSAYGSKRHKKRTQTKKGRPKPTVSDIRF